MFYFIALIMVLVAIAFKLSNISFNLTNPLLLLWGTWMISVAICLANVFDQYPMLSAICLLFLLGFLVLTSLAFLIGKSFRFDYQQFNYDRGRLLLAFNALFILVVMAYAVTIVRLGPPPLFAGGHRAQYYLTGGGELAYLLVYPCFFLGLYFIKQVTAGEKGPVITQLLILTLIIISRGNKMAVFSIVLMICFFWGRRVKLSSIVFLMLGVIVVFSAFSVIYKKNVTDLNALKANRIMLTGFTLPDKWYSLYDPFAYMSSNVYNVDGLLRYHMSGIGLGTLSFKGIFQLLAVIFPPLAHSLSNDLAMANVSLTVKMLSTYSGLGELYFDFGTIISLEIFAVIGFMAGLLNRRPGRQMSVSTSFFLFMLYQTLALSFFTFYLGNLEVITNLIVILCIDLFSRKSIDSGEYLNE